jgi:hypothetical protein
MISTVTACLTYRADRFDETAECCSVCGWLADDHVAEPVRVPLIEQLQARRAS